MPAAPTRPRSSRADPKTVRVADLCRLASLPVATAFGVVLGLHFAIHSFILPDAVASPEFDEGREDRQGFSLPFGHRASIAGLNSAGNQRGTGNAFGEHSKEWLFADKVTPVGVSFDYPFEKFHHLVTCYAGKGWTVERYKSMHEPEDAKAPAVWNEFDLVHKAGGQFGYVAFAEFNAQGDSLQGESRLLGALLRHEKALQALYDRIFRPAEFNAPKPIGPAYQIQAFTMADKPIDAEDRAAVREMFFLALRELREPLFGQKK